MHHLGNIPLMSCVSLEIVDPIDILSGSVACTDYRFKNEDVYIDIVLFGEQSSKRDSSNANGNISQRG